MYMVSEVLPPQLDEVPRPDEALTTDANTSPHVNNRLRALILGSVAAGTALSIASIAYGIHGLHPEPQPYIGAPDPTKEQVLTPEQQRAANEWGIEQREIENFKQRALQEQRDKLAQAAAIKEAIAESPFQNVAPSEPKRIVIDIPARTAQQVAEQLRAQNLPEDQIAAMQTEFPDGTAAVHIDAPVGSMEGIQTSHKDAQGFLAYKFDPPVNDADVWNVHATTFGVVRSDPNSANYNIMPEDDHVVIGGHNSSKGQAMAFNGAERILPGDSLSLYTNTGVFTFAATKRVTPAKGNEVINDPLINTVPVGDQGTLKLFTCLADEDRGFSTNIVGLRFVMTSAKPY